MVSGQSTSLPSHRSQIHSISCKSKIWKLHSHFDVINSIKNSSSKNEKKKFTTCRKLLRIYDLFACLFAIFSFFLSPHKLFPRAMTENDVIIFYLGKRPL